MEYKFLVLRTLTVWLVSISHQGTLGYSDEVSDLRIDTRTLAHNRNYEEKCDNPIHDTISNVDSRLFCKNEMAGSGSPKYKLTYFNARWLCEPIRLILSYVKEDFEDVRIEEEDWPNIKPNFPYGVLPTLEDRDAPGVKFTQSFAIARYLAKKYNLVGANAIEGYKCDEYADCVKDLLKDMETVYYAEDETRKAARKENFLSVTAPKFFAPINADLKSNGETYLVGNGVTWVDFLLAHFTELCEVYLETPLLLENYPSIKAHQKRIFNLPEIQKWLAKRPITEV